MHLTRDCDCDEVPGPKNSVAVSVAGADIVAANSFADIVVLRLRHPPPSGAEFVRVRRDLPSVGTEVIGFHHPEGRTQAYAFGRIDEHIQCDWLGTCPGGWVPGPGPDFLTVYWKRGSTGNGSSGSGLFDAEGRLIGVLHGGASYNPGSSGPDDYGWVGGVAEIGARW